MTSQKLFVFINKKNDIAVIIRKEKKNKKNNYQIIKWDIQNNIFTEGQWLLKKQLFIKGCSISPDGKYFGWLYNTYQHNNETYAGISLIPNFTAILFGTGGIGRYLTVQFDKNSMPINNQSFELKSNIILKKSITEIPVYSGLQELNFILKTGEKIIINGYNLIMDGNIIYDATNNIFTNCSPII